MFISGVDIADETLIVGRTQDARTGRLKPCLFVVPRDTPGFGRRRIDMELSGAEKQFELTLDDVRLPADALVGDEDAGLLQLFAGLNPERVMTAAFAIGMGRYALSRAVEYARDRTVWKQPIGAHQAIAHPLAQAHIDLELARLMMQKAAFLYDSGDDAGAGEAANMAKYAAGEACVKAVDQAVHTLGGNGLTREFGLASLITAAARVSYRTGEPGDDSQLRLPPDPGAAEVLLAPQPYRSRTESYEEEPCSEASMRTSRPSRCPSTTRCSAGPPSSVSCPP